MPAEGYIPPLNLDCPLSICRPQRQGQEDLNTLLMQSLGTIKVWLDVIKLSLFENNKWKLEGSVNIRMVQNCGRVQTAPEYRKKMTT